MKTQKQLSLVEQAKMVPILIGKKEITKEMVDLALAWARGEVTMGQINKVIEKKGSYPYTMMALALRQYVQNEKK